MTSDLFHLLAEAAPAPGGGAPASGGTPSTAAPADAPPAQESKGLFDIGILLPIGLMFAVMYFLMIRPQQQKQQEMSKLQSGLKKGDRVLTQAGIYGTVVGVDGDKAVLRVDENVKLEFQRSTIIGVVGEKA